MTLVLDKFRSLLPSRAKSSPSGWTSFNAPCCHHRGHNADKRKRGGIRFDTGVVYNCFNCKYTASWQPGRPLSNKFKNLCRWMGASDDDIKEMVFEALKTESPEYEAHTYEEKVEFTERELPEGALPIVEWVEAELGDDLAIKLADVIEYVLERGFNPTSGDFYWSPVDGYSNRVIVPFKYKGKIVGNTARKITKGNPKYLSDHPPHFVFNVDKQTEEQKYVFVVEGPLDALKIGGVALTTNDIADQQKRIINSLGGEIIVIPDQDRAGVNLIDKASELGWSVAFPTWEDDIKDVADAVDRYGKLFVAVDAIKTAQNHPAKINIAKLEHERKLERIDE